MKTNPHLKAGLQHSSDLNNVPGLFKRGGAVKKRKKHTSAPGRIGTTDHSDFSQTNNTPMDTMAQQFGFGGDVGGFLKTLAPFAGMVPGVGTLVGAGAGMLGSTLESTDPNSPTHGKFNFGSALGSGISGAMGGFGGYNPLMVGAGEGTFRKGGCMDCGGRMQYEEGGPVIDEFSGVTITDGEFEYAKGGWIRKAAASIKRRGTAGKCTPITKPGCTGRARALALTFKKIARRRKHEDGGELHYAEGGDVHNKPGGSNVGKKTFANGQPRTGPYVGPSGGAPKGSYPVPDINHARAALSLSHHAPNPAGIKAAVYRKFPQLKHEDGGGIGFGGYKSGGWIKHAINPSHKGWCTPLSNPHCTGHRRALAMRFKHGDLHKAYGGEMYADGGQMSMVPAEVEGRGTQEGTPIKMRGGELLAQGGKVIRNFVAGQPHSSGGFDISAPEGTIVIPKNQSERYINSSKKDRKMMEQSLVSRQARRDEHLMRKGGLVRKYADGGPTGGPEDFLNPPPYGIPIPMAPAPYRQYNGQGAGFDLPDYGNMQPPEPTFGDMGYKDINPVTPKSSWPYNNNTDLRGNYPYTRPTRPESNSVDLGGWQKYASLAPLVSNAIDYFQKPEQLNPKDFEVGNIGYHDQKFNREPFLRARASAANDLRNIYSNSPGAYRSSIGSTYSGFASKEQEARNQIENQNAQNRIGVDTTNAGIQGQNKSRAFEIAMQNMANREERRNAGRQFMTNLGKFGDRQANLDFGFDQLEGAYGDQPGYRQNLKRTRRKYTWG